MFRVGVEGMGWNISSNGKDLKNDDYLIICEE